MFDVTTMICTLTHHGFLLVIIKILLQCYIQTKKTNYMVTIPPSLVHYPIARFLNVVG